MTITVRQLRHGTVVRLTGAHAQALTGLLLNLLDGAESPAVASERVPERSEINSQALGAGEAVGASNASRSTEGQSSASPQAKKPRVQRPKRVVQFDTDTDCQKSYRECEAPDLCGQSKRCMGA